MPIEQPTGQHSYAVMATYSGDRSPSLEPAVLRLQRAVRRLNDMAEVVDILKVRADRHPLTVSVSRADAETGLWADAVLRWNYDAVDFEHHQELRVLTGEVVYHLRTALEYVAYHLVWQDRGHPFDHSKFPMIPEGKASEWPKTSARCLPGLTSENLERVRALQPFAGCAWTAELTVLSNVDKHRSPIQVGVATGAQFSTKGSAFRPDPDDASRFLIESTPTLDVRTHDGKPLYATLKHMCIAMNDALGIFSSGLPGPKPKIHSQGQ